MNVGRFRVQCYLCGGCNISWYTEDMDIDGKRFCPVCGDPMLPMGMDGHRLVPETEWKHLKVLRYGHVFIMAHRKVKRKKPKKLVCYRISCHRRARGSMEPIVP